MDIINGDLLSDVVFEKNLTVKMVNIAEGDDRGHKILHSLGLSYESL